ncbi:hypothetical protein CRE_27820 [Caenorhabditis remanei]|uniref:Uncharacterized protein n=2 Tax=Caenorhabditis remanei TaxID=31234 RepID=E3N5J1_CAERE|nr:hypothetical protein CRE_27820 [Caenorhabditis remanei]
MSIRCSPTNSVYCGVLYVYEVDYGASHDVIKKEEFCVDPALYKKDFNWDYSGGDASPQYEITYQLSHNCTSKGVYRCINPEPVDVWVFGE